MLNDGDRVLWFGSSRERPYRANPDGEVKAMLLSNPVCATTFLANYMSAARSRVSELRCGLVDQHRGLRRTQPQD